MFNHMKAKDSKAPSYDSCTTSSSQLPKVGKHFFGRPVGRLSTWTEGSALVGPSGDKGVASASPARTASINGVVSCQEHAVADLRSNY